jgi:superfamily I DNA/RNA helicase
LDLGKLNPQQKEAVEHVNGPVLILAGAGSGKTRVITHRIAYLIEDHGVAADSILAVTFTNKAAAEMGERVSRLVGRTSIAQPRISTFHSFCVRLLRRDIEALRINGQGLTKDFAIYDEADQQSLVKAAIRRLGIDDKQLTPRSVLGRISWAKNHMLDPQEVYLQSADPNTERIAHIYEIYRKELLKANALDFDDLLLEAVRLLKSSAEVRRRYNQRYQYILIDEYQDTNRPQYELMKLLAGEHHNVCVVGDEDQSIYSWRGADIRNILEFERDFPEVKIIRLEQNYRSTQNILESASAVVGNNKQRKGKTLWTDRQGGTPIYYYEAPDGENEALFAADYISRFLKEPTEGDEPRRAAILYRTNSQSRLFEEALRRYGLKYNVVGGFSFYERAEIKDMISYLKLIQNPDDSIAFLRVVNTPARGVGKTTLETLERLSLETGSSLWSGMEQAIEQKLLPARALGSLADFRQIIEDGRAMLGGNFVEKLAGETGSPSTRPSALSIQPVSGVPAASAAAGASPLSDAAEDNNDASFAFGSNEQHELFGAANAPELVETEHAPSALVPEDNLVPVIKGVEGVLSENGLSKIKKKFERFARRADSLGIQPPELHLESLPGYPVRYHVYVHFEPPIINGWTLLGILHHHAGATEAHPSAGKAIPEAYLNAGPDCDHCGIKQRRKDTFILRNEAAEIRQVGSTCLHNFFGGFNPESLMYFSETIGKLKDEIAELSVEQTQRAASPADSLDGKDSVPSESAVEGFRAPGGAATLPEVIKFLIDRTRYVKVLEDEGSPEAFSRIENLQELANAARDSADRAETLGEFLDHAALVSDTDQYEEGSRITLMTLHAAKGLEFPLVFLAGMEEGLFPSSRTFLNPEQIEEERRLCYVGMTRAMDTLVLSRARYRRRYGSDLPDASVPSRFLEEIPPQLMEEIGTSSRRSGNREPAFSEVDEGRHYSYEDEDQSASSRARLGRSLAAEKHYSTKRNGTTGSPYQSIDNIADFFASRGKKFSRPKVEVPELAGKRGFRPGQRVRHPKYGEGTVYKREGDGDDAKITVQFPQAGLKKLVEKFAQLERV